MCATHVCIQVVLGTIAQVFGGKDEVGYDKVPSQGKSNPHRIGERSVQLTEALLLLLISRKRLCSLGSSSDFRALRSSLEVFQMDSLLGSPPEERENTSTWNHLRGGSQVVPGIRRGLLWRRSIPPRGPGWKPKVSFGFRLAHNKI